MKRMLGTIALTVTAAVVGATVAFAATSGTLNVTRDGNSTSSGRYDFKAAKTSSGAYKTQIVGTFNVTEPTARVDARIDAYGYTNGAKRTTKGSSTYNLYLWGDTTIANSASLRVCYEGALWWDCTSKTVNR